MGNTKGVTANNYIAYIERRADPDQMALIKERMSPAALRVLFDQPILVMGFVDFGAVLELLVAADGVIGAGDGALLRQASYDNQMRNLNGIYRALMPLMSLEFLIKRASKLWQRYHDTGRMSSKQQAPNEVELTLSDYPDIPEHHAPEIEGAFEALLHVARARDVRIVHTECANDGGSCCRWTLTWTA